MFIIIQRNYAWDETRNVAEYDSEKAAVTDAQETTANEQTKPRTKKFRLDSKIKGLCNCYVVIGMLVYIIAYAKQVIDILFHFIFEFQLGIKISASY
jgi:hypothetical protein